MSSNTKKQGVEHVFTCGSSAIFVSHKSGEPTFIDKTAAVLSNLFGKPAVSGSSPIEVEVTRTNNRKARVVARKKNRDYAA